MDILYDIIHDIETHSTRRNRSIALFLAIIIYLLIAAALFLETVIVHDRYMHSNTPYNPNKVVSALPPDKKAAPVIYMPNQKRQQPVAQAGAPAVSSKPAQQKSASPTPPATVQPQQSLQKKLETPTQEQKITPQPDIAPVKTPEQPLTKELPKIEERKVPLAPTIPLPTEHRAPVQETKVPDQPQPSTEYDDEELEEMMARRRSKGKWYKNGMVPEQQQMPQRASHARESHAGYYSRGMPHYEGAEESGGRFYRHNDNDPKKMGSSFRNGSAPEDDAKAVEYGLFLYKFDQTFCRESRMNPMRVHKSLIQEHIIELEVACNKQRKISSVNLITPSYDPAINEYILQILNGMMPPQLPAGFPEDRALIFMRIKVDRVYQQNIIYFVPTAF